jgi:hypothetical protein
MLFSFGTLQYNNGAPMLERPFLAYCERCHNVDPSSRSAKIEAKIANKRISLYNPVEN